MENGCGVPRTGRCFGVALIISFVGVSSFYVMFNSDIAHISPSYLTQVKNWKKLFHASDRSPIFEVFGHPTRTTNVSECWDFVQDKVYSLVLRKQIVNCIHPAQKQNSTLRIKTIAWINIPVWERRVSFDDCPVSACRITSNESVVATADAVIAQGPRLPDRSYRRSNPDQVWILYGLESPRHYHSSITTNKWKSKFNWTMTYRLDSDILRPYAYLLEKDANQTSNRDSEVLAIARKKTRSVAWFVSNCNAPSERTEYVNRLKQYIDVDIYGKCGPGKCSNEECKKLLSSTYMFYLSFENSLCKDYVTEKLFKVYQTDSVGVVRGGVDYQKLVPNGTYINVDSFEGPAKLAAYLKHLRTNLTEYVAILKKKRQYWSLGNPEIGQQAWQCLLCAKLHSNYTRKSYSNINDWLNNGMCYGR